MNRIKELRESIPNLSQTKLGKIVNVHQTAISQWETGRTTPDIETSMALANYFGVSLDYLLGKEENSASPKRTGVRIPVYGSVAAGIPIEAISNIEEYEEITEEQAAKGEYFALRIKGESMEPDIRDGSVVIVKRQDHLESGQVAIVSVNGYDATCKRVQMTPDGLMLISNNPKFKPMFYTKQEIDELPIRILGLVEECRTKIL